MTLFHCKRALVLSLRAAALLLSALLLFEAALRMSGLFFRHGVAATGGKTTVLCVGDSFVWGVGGESFPQQLSELLNSGPEGPRYLVINAGKAGANSAQTAQSLPALLRLHKPAVVVALFGMNNSWNTDGLSGAAWLKQNSRVWRFLASLAAEPHSAQAGAPSGGCEPDFEDGFDYVRTGTGSVSSQALPSPPDAKLVSDPQRLAGYYGLLSSAYSSLGRSAEAVEAAGKACALNPSDRALLLRLGDAQLAFGDYGGAERTVKLALRSYPKDDGVNFLAGSYYARRAAPAPLNPMAGSALFAGGLLERRAAYSSAADYFLKAIESNRDDDKYYAAALEALTEGGRLGEAARLAEYGMESFPMSQPIASQAMRLDLLRGRMSAARKIVINSRTVFSKDEATAVSAAYVRVLLETGHAELARNEAAVLSRFGPDAPLEAAAALKSGRQYADAAQLLEQAAADVPGNADMKAALADLYLRSCRPAQAVAAADAALKINSAHAAASYFKGCALAFAGDYAQAAVWLEKARSLAPENIVVLVQLARLHYKKGIICLDEKNGACARMPQSERAAGAAGFDKALRFYLQALRMQPYSMPVAEELAAMLHEEGKTALLPSLLRDNAQLRKNAVFAAVLENRYAPAGLEILPDAAFNRRLNRDARRIAADAAAAGAFLVLSSYPENDFEAVRAAARAYGLPYVDLTALFRKKFARRSEYVAYDSFHCNSAGYKLMAEAYAVEIRRLQKP